MTGTSPRRFPDLVATQTCPLAADVALHPEWVPWPDWDPALAARTRRAFLERYCDTDTLICTAHFPLPSAGRIVRAGDAFRLVYDECSW